MRKTVPCPKIPSWQLQSYSCVRGCFYVGFCVATDILSIFMSLYGNLLVYQGRNVNNEMLSCWGINHHFSPGLPTYTPLPRLAQPAGLFNSYINYTFYSLYILNTRMPAVIKKFGPYCVMRSKVKCATNLDT